MIHTMSKFTKLIPQEGLDLVKYSGKDLINRLGKDVIENVVLSILCGDNLRDLTESLTQRRILLMNSSLVITYLRALHSYKNFAENISNIVKQELLQEKLSVNEKSYLYWFIGLTGKSIQNVLRDKNELETYLYSFDKNMKEVAKDIEKRYGAIDISLKNEGIDYLMNWPSLLQCMLAMGAQTLTIRGSEKSLYGKLFEKFILGSVLSILGFDYISRNDTKKNNMVFWLSERKDKRESDATIILKPGFGVRFDIGFIGRGNTEISLDKVTRFEKIMEKGNSRYSMMTIILIDTIGERSRTEIMAEEIGGHIIQMSGTYWVYELAHILKREFSFFEHPILEMSKDDSLDYLKKCIHEIDLSKFFVYFQ